MNRKANLLLALSIVLAGALLVPSGVVPAGSTFLGAVTAVSLPHTTTTTVSCTPSTVPVNHATTCTAVITDTSTATPVPPTGTVGFTTSGLGTFTGNPCTPASISPSASSCSLTYTPFACSA